MSLTNLFKSLSGFGSSSRRRRARRRPCRDYTAAIESLETRTLLSAGSFLEVVKLTASDAAAGDAFGTVAVSENGQTIVVGSPGDDDAGEISGSAYVYKWNGSSFDEIKLTASDAAVGDVFGTSVAVSADGETVVVGSRFDEVGGSKTGSAYVYKWNGSSFDETKLTASDAAHVRFFGNSVAVSADGATVVVGSPADDDAGSASGSAYVYKWNGSSFAETKLTASDAAAGDNFGLSVSVSADGETVVVGSNRDDDAGDNSGSAYVYQWNGNSFVESKLTASDAAAGDQFGVSVSVSADGETVVVGSHLDDDAGDNSGSAYVYEWNGSSFDETKLTASDAAAEDHYGVSVSVSADGQTVVVGSHLDDDAGNKSGSAYVYEWNGSSFFESKLTASDAAAGDEFGSSVSVSADGQTVVVGSIFDDDVDFTTGSAYVFVFDDSPLGQIVNLSNQVKALGLPKGIENGMLKELTGAFDKLQDHNPDNDEAAIGKLLSFIDKVEDQRGERLTDEQADALIAAAEETILQISNDLGLTVFDEALFDLL